MCHCPHCVAVPRHTKPQPHGSHHTRHTRHGCRCGLPTHLHVDQEPCASRLMDQNRCAALRCLTVVPQPCSVQASGLPFLSVLRCHFFLSRSMPTHVHACIYLCAHAVRSRARVRFQCVGLVPSSFPGVMPLFAVGLECKMQCTVLTRCQCMRNLSSCAGWQGNQHPPQFAPPPGCDEYVTAALICTNFPLSCCMF